MSDGVFKYKERRLGYYKDDSTSGLELVDVLASKDKEKIEKFTIENETPKVSIQLLSFILENNIPFESISKMDRLVGLEKLGRYGNQFAISTKSLIESLPKTDLNTGEIDKSNQQVYGMDLLDLENTFYEYSLSHPSFANLSYSERDSFVMKKITEFRENPARFYPRIKKLMDPGIRSLSSELPDDMMEGTKLYLFLYSQMFFPINKEGEYAQCNTFEKPKKTPSYFFCKDSEYYFNARLSSFDTENSISPDRTVFSSDDKPVLLQKTGGYKTDYGDGGDTNATALNLEPIFVSGILYPPGTLFGVIKKGNPDYVRKSGDQHYDISEIEGLVPLRLSIYSVSKDSDERQEAFGVHYKDFKSEITTQNTAEGELNDFREISQQIISDSRS